MSFNGSGVFVVNSTGQPVVASTLIEASVFNAFTADVATGLSTCITKDGQTTVTANIPFGGFKLTGVGAATARTDAASLASIQDGTGVYVGTVGGTADVITLTPSPAIAAYAAGQTFRFIASGANTTNVTVAVSGLAAKAITKNGTTALVAGDIPSGSTVEITYDGTQFQLGSIGAATFSALPVVDTTALVKGSSDATKLLRIEVDGITTGTTRVWTVPDADLTVVGEGTTQTLTNKTLTSPVINTGVSGTALADQAAQETGTSTSLIVQPGVQHFHPSASKAWVMFTQSGTTVTVRASYNVTGVARNGVGDYTVTIGNDFSSQYYAYTVNFVADRSNITSITQAAGTFQFTIARVNDGAAQEVSSAALVFFGDL